MKSTKILVNAILIPALLVASGQGASDSVQKLLHNPQTGRARITFTDGTEAAGVVNRVTTQFLTLQELDTCRNVELAQIAAIKWLPHQGDPLGETLTWLVIAAIASPILVPIYIASLLADRNENSPLDGNWESIPMPDGKISRIEGDYQKRFVQRSVAVEKGRYVVIGQELHLTYDESGLTEAIPLQFDCESLVLGAEKLSAQSSTNSAQPPIVGRWHPNRNRGDSWEFTVSGTFEKRIAESQFQGQIKKIKGGVHVKWLGPDAKPDEDWAIRTKGHHLFITAGGATTEYIRAAD